VNGKQRVVIPMDALRPLFELRPDVSMVDGLRRFRRGCKHLAVVREREGPVLGICTLEGVLEEIVGEIEDEPTSTGVQ
jgi:CBS domain containing-hemolysin-like protein